MAAAGRRSYRRTSLAAAVGGFGLITLDVTLIAAALAVVPSITTLLSLAVATSLARIGFIIRWLPRIIRPDLIPS